MDILQRQHAFDQIEMHMAEVKKHFIGNTESDYEELEEKVNELEDELEKKEDELIDKENELQTLQEAVDKVKKMLEDLPEDDLPDSVNDIINDAVKLLQ